MNKNEAIKNPTGPATDPGSTSRAPDRDGSQKGLGSAPLDGRIEKRAPVAIPVCLVSAEELPFAETALTVNVSHHGARVVTERRWQTEERPWLASLSNEFRVCARVIYCQPLPDGRFCVGLGFPAGPVTLGDQTWW